MKDQNVKKYVRIAVIVLLCPVILYIIFSFLADLAMDSLMEEMQELKLVSPDNEHVIIIRESQFLLNGRTDIYYRPAGKTSIIPWFSAETRITTMSNDGTCIFVSGCYDVTWDEDRVTLRYRKFWADETDDPATWQVFEYCCSED